jgi:putative phosphoribosyl transferase
MSEGFSDRRAGGRALADVLRNYAGAGDVVVLALPRGGVPVAVEVAMALGAPLGLLLPGEDNPVDFGSALPAPLDGMTAIVIDDGVITGATMCAALKSLRGNKPAWIVVAVPVAPPQAQDLIGTAADEFVAACTPEDFDRLDRYYRNFDPVEDDEVQRLLAQARAAGC